jgi:hypothetical protein
MVENESVLAANAFYAPLKIGNKPENKYQNRDHNLDDSNA